jgi:DNA-binding IscR family transcriptional regulator
LAQSANKINLRAVYAAVETGPLFALHPSGPNPQCPVGGTIQGALEPALAAAEGALLGSLAETTVADLVGRLGQS